MPDGSINTNPETVLYKWGSDFEDFLNPMNTATNGFDNYTGYFGDNNIDYQENEQLDCMISIDEVLKCILHAKAGKATGYVDIPCELLKNDSALALLHNLFNRCFVSGTVPSAWSKSIITPVQNHPHRIQETLCPTEAYHWPHQCIKYTALF